MFNKWTNITDFWSSKSILKHWILYLHKRENKKKNSKHFHTNTGIRWRYTQRSALIFGRVPEFDVQSLFFNAQSNAKNGHFISWAHRSSDQFFLRNSYRFFKCQPKYSIITRITMHSIGEIWTIAKMHVELQRKTKSVHDDLHHYFIIQHRPNVEWNGIGKECAQARTRPNTIGA